MHSGATQPAMIADRGPDRSARMSGMCLLLTAIATTVMVFTRVAADADQDTLLESLRAVDENRALYGVSGAARLLSGVALFLASWFLLQTWIIRDRWATPLVLYLFALSGVCTVLSGACAVAIAAYPAFGIGIAGGDIAEAVEGLSGLRWSSGKIGFVAAGLAVIVAARHQRQVGGALRWIAPYSAVLGIVMQFIWVDSATIMHPIAGTAFFLWLVAVGTMLLTGRVERHFVHKHRVASQQLSIQVPRV